MNIEKLIKEEVNKFNNEIFEYTIISINEPRDYVPSKTKLPKDWKAETVKCSEKDMWDIVRNLHKNNRWGIRVLRNDGNGVFKVIYSDNIYKNYEVPPEKLNSKIKLSDKDDE